MTQRSSAEPTIGPLSEGESAALLQGQFDPAPRDLGDQDPILLGKRQLAALAEASLTFEETVSRLGITRQQLHERLAMGTVYWFHGPGGGEMRIPAFQFLPGGGLIPGIDVVVAAFRADATPTSVADWFFRPHVDLFFDEEETPVSPLAWLSAGRDPSEAAKFAVSDFENP